MHEIIMQQAVMVANGFQGFSRSGTTWVPLMLIDLHRLSVGLFRQLLADLATQKFRHPMTLN